MADHSRSVRFGTVYGNVATPCNSRLARHAFVVGGMREVDGRVGPIRASYSVNRPGMGTMRDLVWIRQDS